MKKKIFKFLFYKVQILNNYLWRKSYSKFIENDNGFLYKIAQKTNKFLNYLRKNS